MKKLLNSKPAVHLFFLGMISIVFSSCCVNRGLPHTKLTFKDETTSLGPLLQEVKDNMTWLLPLSVQRFILPELTPFLMCLTAPPSMVI